MNTLDLSLPLNNIINTLCFEVICMCIYDAPVFRLPYIIHVADAQCLATILFYKMQH